VQPVPPTEPGREVFLRRGSLVSLVVGIGLLAASLGLLPFAKVGISPIAGTVLCGVGLGRIWARRTGRRGYFLIAVGVGIALGGVLARWSGAASSGLILAGVITTACGVVRLLAPQARAPRADAKQASEKPQQ
jgi:hypothetical protein